MFQALPQARAEIDAHQGIHAPIVQDLGMIQKEGIMSHHIYRKRLLLRLRELGVRLEHVDRELGAEHVRDWDDQAIEREGEEVLERLGAAGLAERQRIMAALRRMSEGSYGLCLRCGDPIAPERLNAVPEAPLCRHCAASAG